MEKNHNFCGTCNRDNGFCICGGNTTDHPRHRHYTSPSTEFPVWLCLLLLILIFFCLSSIYTRFVSEKTSNTICHKLLEQCATNKTMQ